jgi:hypothetical protein
VRAGAGASAGAGVSACACCCACLMLLFLLVKTIPIFPDDIILYTLYYILFFYTQQLTLPATIPIELTLLPYKGADALFVVCVLRIPAFFRFK